LPERPAQISWFADDRRSKADRCIGQRDWSESRRDRRRCAARNAHHAVIHVVLLKGLVLVAALIRTAIVLRLDSHGLLHRTGFNGDSR